LAAVCGAFFRTLSVRFRFAVDDGLNLLPVQLHRRAEPIELVLRLALGRLDHQRAGHGKRHRRRVKPSSHENRENRDLERDVPTREEVLL
jgi:hypothetical protein